MVVPGDSVEFLPDFARFLLERSYYNLALSFLMAMGNIPSIFTTAIFEGSSSVAYFSLRCTAIHSVWYIAVWPLSTGEKGRP